MIDSLPAHSDTILTTLMHLEAHSDTILTTLMHLEKCLTTFGMQYIHVTVDMKLYQSMCLVQWSDPEQWRNLIIHPRMMHSLMSFVGCIGTLMKASSQEVFISAAFVAVSAVLLLGRHGQMHYEHTV